MSPGINRGSVNSRPATLLSRRILGRFVLQVISMPQPSTDGSVAVREKQGPIRVNLNQTFMTIIIGNQKGAAGKSTLTMLLANYLTMEKSCAVTVIDMDYQQSIAQKYDKAK